MSSEQIEVEVGDKVESFEPLTFVTQTKLAKADSEEESKGKSDDVKMEKELDKEMEMRMEGLSLKYLEKVTKTFLGSVPNYKVGRRRRE